MNADTYYSFAGTDFVAISSSLVFSPGDNAIMCEELRVVDDSIVEGSEVFSMTLSSDDPQVVTLAPSNQLNITILDDDGRC